MWYEHEGTGFVRLSVGFYYYLVVGKKKKGFGLLWKRAPRVLFIIIASPISPSAPERHAPSKPWAANVS